MTNQTRPSSPSVLAVILISLLFLVYVFDRVIVPVESVEIRTDLSFSLPQIGFLGTVFTFGLVLVAVPAGLFAARYGIRASLILGAATFSISTLWFAVTGSYAHMVAARIVGGIGEGLFNVTILSFIGRITHKHRGFGIGIPGSLFGLGVFLAPLVIKALQAVSTSWRSPFIVLGLVGLATAALIAAIMKKDAPSGAAKSTLSLARVRSVLTPPALVIYFLAAANGLIIYSYIALLPSYLHAQSSLSAAEISIAFSLFGLGNAVGGIAFGAVGDYVGRGRFLATATPIVGILVGAVYWITPSASAAAMLSLLAGFGTTAIYCNSIAIVQDLAGQDDIPIATGLLAIVYYAMSAVSGYIVGWLVERVGWTASGVVAYAMPILLLAPFVIAFVGRAGPPTLHKASAVPDTANADLMRIER
jgi:MFS family permease